MWSASTAAFQGPNTPQFIVNSLHLLTFLNLFPRGAFPEALQELPLYRLCATLKDHYRAVATTGGSFDAVKARSAGNKLNHRCTGLHFVYRQETEYQALRKEDGMPNIAAANTSSSNSGKQAIGPSLWL